MTKSVNKNYTPDTVGQSLVLNDFLFPTEFAKTKVVAGETTVTNVSCPVAYPEIFRFASQDVPNVYKGTGIPANLQAPATGGKSVLVSLRDTWTVVDSTDATYEVALPMSAHLVIKVPNNSALTSDMVRDFVVRMLSGLFPASSTGSGRINELLHGITTPAGM